MTTPMETQVSTNDDQQCYVIRHPSHVRSLDYDDVLDGIERVVIELVGRGVLSESYLDVELAAVKAKRGAIETYDTYRNLRERLRRACQEDGDEAVCDLTPQLTGLEGCRVEVVDEPGGAPRRFVVSKSTGWAPAHVEIGRRGGEFEGMARLGGAARREYHSVRVIHRPHEHMPSAGRPC